MYAGLSFSVDAKAFGVALADVIRATAKRSNVAVLGGVLIEATDGRGLELTATDMEIRATVSLDAPITNDGAVVVADPKSLLALIKTLKGLISVSFNVDSLALEVETSGGARFSFETIAAVDFPAAADFGGSHGQIHNGAFGVLLGQVLPAISRDYSRPVLTAACMEISGDRLTVATTDSYRLAMDSMSGCSGDPLEAVNVPGQALRELQRIAKRKGQPTLIDWEVTGSHPSWIRFRTGAYAISTRLVDGQYPDWRKLLPTDHTVSWNVSAGDLAAATMRVAATMAKKDLKPVRVAADDGAATLTVSATVIDGAGGSETVAAATGYPPMEIGFNPDFLTDALTFCGETARVRLISPLRPAVFLNGKESDESFHLLMPVRLAEI